MKKVAFLFIMSFLASALQAQEGRDNEAGLLEAQTDSSSQMSPVLTEEGQQDIVLIALASTSDVAPEAGVCLVISDMLAQFCNNNPMDGSCQTQ